MLYKHLRPHIFDYVEIIPFHHHFAMADAAVSARKAAVKPTILFRREGLTIINSPLNATLEYALAIYHIQKQTVLTDSLKHCLPTRAQWASP
jgi:hypothetical protein